MEKEENQIPFGDLLTSLINEEVVPIHHLYRLSDMGVQETLDFRRQWLTASDLRRQEIMRHLADITEDNFIVDFEPVFAFALQDSYAPVRVAALDGLWDSTDATLVDPIINLLAEDPAIEVQASAASSLAHYLIMSEWGQLPGLEISIIFEALRNAYKDPMAALQVKCAALEAMGPVPLTQVAGLIEEAFEGHTPELQLSALFAMGTSADPRWLPILVDEMESPNSDMRAEAARAAGAIGDSRFVSQLSELAFDEEEDVARAAITALGQISGEESHRILNELLADSALTHLHEAAEVAMEETVWLEGDLQLFPWTDDERDENDDIGDNH